MFRQFAIVDFLFMSTVSGSCCHVGCYDAATFRHGSRKNTTVLSLLGKVSMAATFFGCSHCGGLHRIVTSYKNVFSHPLSEIPLIGAVLAALVCSCLPDLK